MSVTSLLPRISKGSYFMCHLCLVKNLRLKEVVFYGVKPAWYCHYGVHSLAII